MSQLVAIKKTVSSMNSYGSFMEPVIEQMEKVEEEHACIHCHRIVPKLELMILGKKRLVQPICQCESKAEEKERESIIDRKQRREEEAKLTLLSQEFHGKQRLEEFELRPGTGNAVIAVKDFLQEVGKGGGPLLYLHGGTGCGKSHLAIAITNQVRGRYSMVYQSASQVLGMIRSSFSSNEKEQNILYTLTNCDLLILEDLGMEKPSDWSLEIIHKMIERRNQLQKPIVITSNYDLMALKRRYTASSGLSDSVLGERIISRIAQGGNKIVHNQGKDYRLEQAILLKQKSSFS